MKLAKIVNHDVKCSEEGVHVEHEQSAPFPVGSGGKPTLRCGHLPLKSSLCNSHQAFNGFNNLPCGTRSLHLLDIPHFPYGSLRTSYARNSIRCPLHAHDTHLSPPHIPLSVPAKRQHCSYPLGAAADESPRDIAMERQPSSTVLWSADAPESS
jgi:hypothetical protein